MTYQTPSNKTMERFIKAQREDYKTALKEISDGRKRSHWMWYIFPQVAGLGYSETSRYYAIRDVHEAQAYLDHPVLGPRLVEISEALLGLETTDPHAVFGSPDDMKLKSSMTLFAALPGSNPVFQAVLDKFFSGKKDEKTLQLMQG
jgi:uncharacterized protein (DUF1810 family)